VAHGSAISELGRQGCRGLRGCLHVAVKVGARGRRVLLFLPMVLLRVKCLYVERRLRTVRGLRGVLVVARVDDDGGPYDDAAGRRQPVCCCGVDSESCWVNAIVMMVAACVRGLTPCDFGRGRHSGG
jgi:hypothetical protein